MSLSSLRSFLYSVLLQTAFPSLFISRAFSFIVDHGKTWHELHTKPTFFSPFTLRARQLSRSFSSHICKLYAIARAERVVSYRSSTLLRRCALVSSPVPSSPCDVLLDYNVAGIFRFKCTVHRTFSVRLQYKFFIFFDRRHWSPILNHLSFMTPLFRRNAFPK